MTTIGKVCLWLTVIGLVVISGYLLPTVGKQHNDVSARLQKSEKAVDDAIDAHRDQSQRLEDRKQQLARLQIGWDKSWDIQQTANTRVDVERGQLAVAGLGRDFGLAPALDAAGQEAPPAVHAFKARPDGGMFYVGEFQAKPLEATTTILVPIWRVTDEELDVWTSDPELPWRFRTLVPAGDRLEVDQLHAQRQKLTEMYAEVDANTIQQQRLLKEAEAQLVIRKQELLGSPDAQPTPGRPEYSEGLVKAVSAEEDRRNNLQINVDSLRRQIKAANEEREMLIRRLKEYPDLLPSADSDQITQSGGVVQ
jgi:hypothetical protein